MVERAELWWADLGSPRGSAPAYRRPVLVVSAQRFNRSAINTVVVAAVTSNVRLASAPGNHLLSEGVAGLGRPSVVNVSQLLTLDKRYLQTLIGSLPAADLRLVDRGLRLVLDLPG